MTIASGNLLVEISVLSTFVRMSADTASHRVLIESRDLGGGWTRLFQSRSIFSLVDDALIWAITLVASHEHLTLFVPSPNRCLRGAQYGMPCILHHAASLFRHVIMA